MAARGVGGGLSTTLDSHKIALNNRSFVANYVIRREPSYKTCVYLCQSASYKIFAIIPATA